MTKHHEELTDKNESITDVEAQSAAHDVEAEKVNTPEFESDDVVENTEEEPMEEQNKQANEVNSQVEKVVVKKGGSGLAILALLVALGLGGAGYYFADQHLVNVQARLNSLEQQKAKPANIQGFLDTDLAALKQDQEKISLLTDANQSINQKLDALEKIVSIKDQQISALQNQLDTLSNAQKAAQPNDWLLSEADFLLNNALRKLVLDNDVDTAVSLLKVADETLLKVSDPRVVGVRTAINSDLKQLLSVNNIDQNAIMQRLSQLANSVDELTVLNVNFDEPKAEDSQLSGSWDDWKQNAEKSATSFLNHFIRITPKKSDSRALLAPNQDIYLRENIRLRLQLAIMAVPRQQNDLYKQSLETVAAWIRSYFDTTTEMAQNFLNEVDELADQSIYVDVPTQLNSLNTLDKLLNKPSQEVQKIEISVDKDIAQETLSEVKSGSTPENEKTLSQEEKSTESKAKDDENSSAVEKSSQPEVKQQ